jgi:hypothetical protein
VRKTPPVSGFDFTYQPVSFFKKCKTTMKAEELIITQFIPAFVVLISFVPPIKPVV